MEESREKRVFSVGAAMNEYGPVEKELNSRRSRCGSVFPGGAGERDGGGNVQAAAQVRKPLHDGYDAERRKAHSHGDRGNEINGGRGNEIDEGQNGL